MTTVVAMPQRASLQADVDRDDTPSMDTLRAWARERIDSDAFDKEMTAGVTDKFANLRQIRALLKFFKDYRAPEVKRDEVHGDVRWPADYDTIASYQGRLNQFGGHCFTDATVEFSAAASDIAVRVSRMQQTMTRLLDGLRDYRSELVKALLAAGVPEADIPADFDELVLLAEDELGEDRVEAIGAPFLKRFKKALIRIAMYAEKGRQTCANTQGYVVTMSEQVTTFKSEAVAVQNAYGEVIGQLKAQFTSGDQSMAQVLQRAEKRRDDLQDSISAREKRMIGAGIGLGSTVVVFGIAALGMAIWLSVEGGLLKKEKDQLAEIMSDIRDVGSAVAFKRLVEEKIHGDLAKISNKLNELDQALQRVGQHFGAIYRKFRGIQDTAETNVRQIAHAIEPDREEMEAIVATLAEIAEIADCYIANSLKTDFVDQDDGDVDAIKDAA